jgi:hypothetical protein
MRTATERLQVEHRELEERLDALGAAIGSGAGIAEKLREAAESAHRHYRREQPFLDCLEGHEPALARKLYNQHQEAIEIAARFDEALADGQTRDMLALARRFHAIAEHNIIEQERDVFPLADRCFSAAEQQELLARMAAEPQDPDNRVDFY